MSTDRRGVIPRVRRTFPTVTNIISFLSREHSHTVCFEVLVELTWIGMKISHSTGNSVLPSETPLKTAVRNATTHFANWASRFCPTPCPNYKGICGQFSEIRAMWNQMRTKSMVFKMS